MLDLWEIFLRLLLAAVLGGIIGANRERRDWAAGLRTHMLVCVGAALTIIVSAYGFGDVLGRPHVILDPSRIAAQVISGIGFLGAGTILFMHREQVVRGLTTAAGLWAVAAIGLAAGSGMYAAAAMTTVLVWVILGILKPLERRVFAQRKKTQQHPRMSLRLRGETALARVESALRERDLSLFKLVVHTSENGLDEISVLFDRETDVEKLSALADALRTTDGLQVDRIDVMPGR